MDWFSCLGNGIAKWLLLALIIDTEISSTSYCLFFKDFIVNVALFGIIGRTDRDVRSLRRINVIGLVMGGGKLISRLIAVFMLYLLNASDICEECLNTLLFMDV